MIGHYSDLLAVTIRYRRGMDEANAPILTPFIFKPGAVPPEWIQPSQSVDVTARILALWDTTVRLIRDEQLLGQDQRGFLAMIQDHKVNPPPSAHLELTLLTTRSDGV